MDVCVYYIVLYVYVCMYVCNVNFKKKLENKTANFSCVFLTSKKHMILFQGCTLVLAW